MAQLFLDNATSIGRSFDLASDELGGSSDIANVSNYFPTIQPMIGVGDAAPEIHTAPFAAYAGGADGDAACLDGALLLAMTAVDVVTDSATRARLIARPAPDTSTAGSELDSEGADSHVA
jgi:hypothetical protein